MRSAILGGSFDPVHNGHLALARAVMEIGYDRIIFIPAADPPHKKIVGGLSDAQRLDLLAIALEELEWAIVWDGEIRRGGTSYTIDTVRELKRTGVVEGRPGLIIGDDLVNGFPDWKDAVSLSKEAEIILARRGEEDVAFPFPCTRLGNGLWPDSSTDVRKRLLEGKAVVDMLPRGVSEYIERNRLYVSD